MGTPPEGMLMLEVVCRSTHRPLKQDHACVCGKWLLMQRTELDLK